MDARANKRICILECDSDKWSELDKERRFNLLYNKTKKLQIRLANKLIANLTKYESFTSEDYHSVDDIVQECDMLLWQLLQSYDIPYEDFLRLYKSAIWKAVYLSAISKAKLKKNACLTEPADSPQDEEPQDKLAHTTDFDAMFKRMELEWVKDSFSRFLHSTPITETDRAIFGIIAEPPDVFVDFCDKRNTDKKNNNKDFINKVSIAKYLDISPTGVGMSIKKITGMFKRFKRRSQVDNRKVQK